MISVPPEGGGSRRAIAPSWVGTPCFLSPIAGPGAKVMDPWQAGQIRPVPLDDLGSHFRRYRFRVPQAVQAMAQSLRRWGQCAPIVVCWRHDKPEILDGYTRWEAARHVRGMTTLS